ncbi:MAG: LacI family DNA-binding transcriptional regulator, partial [Nocardioidaceae bacterium]
RARIKTAIYETGYIPNAAARSLRSRSTRQLSLVVDDIGNPAYIEIMRSVQQVARQHGHRLLIQSTDGRLDEEVGILRDLAQHYADGLVLTSTRFSPKLAHQLVSPAVPVVVIGSPPDELLVDAVGADARRGARDAVQHLLQRGSSQLAMINGPAETLPAQSRRAGFLDGCGAGGTSGAADPVVVHAPDYTAEAGYHALAGLLDFSTPDGLLCANDQLAIGALEACLDRGVEVPQQLAIAGMDDTREARLCRPTLTSVDLRFADRGRIAGQMLLDRIQGRYDGPPRRVEVPTRLVPRDSTAREVARD